MKTGKIEQLKYLLLAQTTAQGFIPTRLPEVVLMRMDQYLPLAPTVYEPCILIVAQGSKAGIVHGARYVFDPTHCLVLTLPLPLESETFGSNAEPFLGLAIKIAQPMLTELLVQMETVPALRENESGIARVPVSADVLAVAVRLVQALESPERTRVLGHGILRELIYLLLCGPGGGALASLALGSTHRQRIGKVIERMHRNFATPFSVLELAREVGMSASTFHDRFKMVTGFSPLHYQKLIRLHKARDLMVNRGTTVQAAAIEVGYESPSQFSREFRKLFGASPGVVAAGLRSRLEDLHQTRLSLTLSF